MVTNVLRFAGGKVDQQSKATSSRKQRYTFFKSKYIFLMQLCVELLKFSLFIIIIPLCGCNDSAAAAAVAALLYVCHRMLRWWRW